MKKYGLRVLVGLIAFAIGVSAVIWQLRQRIECDFIPSEIKQAEILPTTYPTNSNGKIEVHFIGYSRKENRPTLKFLIFNNSAGFVKYRAFEKGAIPITIKFKKEIVKRLPGLICGIDDEFSINPKEKIISEEFADLLMFDSLKEKGDFEFGFTFYNSDLEGWSKSITISDKIKKDIIKSAPEFFHKSKNEKPQMLSPKQLAALSNYKW